MSNATLTSAARYADQSTPRPGLIKTQANVIHALVLHDMKSRFFGNGLGYIATIFWPGIHVAIVIGIYYFRSFSHLPPYGSDPLLYASVAVLPYTIWNYVSRFTLLGVTQNRSFLQYPLVKPLDIIIARQSLELVSSTIVTILLAIFLIASGSDPMPHRVADAAFALGSAAFLGIGFGVLGAVIVMIFPLFNIIYVLILIIAWITSGLVLDPETMPTQVGDMFAWNPLLHSIEWMRYAYYDDFPARLLDRTYVLGCAAVTLTLGLILERALRVFTTR